MIGTLRIRRMDSYFTMLKRLMPNKGTSTVTISNGHTKLQFSWFLSDIHLL